MSSAARKAILGRIGQSADPRPAYEAIERTYAALGPVNIDLFIERLIEYGAGVYRCSYLEIAATIRERGIRNIAVPEDIPRDWMPAEVHFITDGGLTYQQLESCDGALTGCAVAIAETGTIILDGSVGQGRRALTLLPDYHLCVVFEEQVFQTVPEAMQFLAPAMSRPLTLISGPSATADIEMTRIQGVHGPRSMDVVLVATRTPSQK